MKLFNADQRKLLSEKLVDFANIGAGALVFGQFFAGTEKNWKVVTVGVAIALFCYGYSLYLLKTRNL